MNVVRVLQGNNVLRNISGVTDGLHWVPLHHSWEKKEYKNEIIHLVFHHFNFWSAIEKYYYVFFLTGYQSNS